MLMSLVKDKVKMYPLAEGKDNGIDGWIMGKKSDITALVSHDRTLNTHHSFPHLSDLHSHHARHISSEEGCIGDYYSGKTPQVCTSSPLQSTVIAKTSEANGQEMPKEWWLSCESSRICYHILKAPRGRNASNTHCQ